MGVYNGQKTIRATLESIISQTMKDWEFLIVDDASTDHTPEILAEYCHLDPRLRVLRKTTNGGLTKALIHGCAEARGTFIARQDVGDISFPTRLEKQVDFLKRNSEVIAVGCGIRRIGPQGEFLGDTIRSLSPSEVTDTFLKSGKAIVHAASMLRRSSYQAVGGYRSEFRVAQDIDLWYRLSEVGLLAELPDTLATISIDLQGISASSNSAQHSLAAIARACYEARKLAQSETDLLNQATQFSQAKSTAPLPGKIRRVQLGESNYFLGSELYSRRNAACRSYLWDSICLRHRIIKALVKYVTSHFLCRNQANHLTNCESHSQ